MWFQASWGVEESMGVRFSDLPKESSLCCPRLRQFLRFEYALVLCRRNSQENVRHREASLVYDDQTWKVLQALIIFQNRKKVA